MLAIFGRFNNPHKEKKEKLAAEIRHYNELSNTAMAMGDTEAYHALQERIRNIYFDMLSASFLETITKLVPHFIVMWLLSLKFKQISIFGIELEVIFYYPLAIIIYYLSKKLYKKIKTITT